jgi:hypothetical protein
MILTHQLLLAQQNGPEDAVVLTVIVIVAAVFLVVGIAITVAILWALYSCYDRIPAQHRQMEPWQVWLLLIPCFNLVWNFMVFPNLSKSFASYFRSVGRYDVGDCGEQVGLWYAICAALSVIPLVNYIAGPASLILLIIFLVKALTLKGQIPAEGLGYEKGFAR